MNCWFCDGRLIWNADFSFEDFGVEGEGIVTILTCPDCGAEFEGYLKLDEEEDDEL